MTRRKRIPPVREPAPAWTAADLRAAIADLGLTGRGAARLLGVHERSLRYWIRDDGGREIPETVRRLLMLCRIHPAARATLEVMQETGTSGIHPNEGIS